MKYGINARVGNVVVFTREGAINTYKMMAKRVFANLTPESSAVLGRCADDMKRLGFSWEEIEQLEIESM